MSSANLSLNRSVPLATPVSPLQANSVEAPVQALPVVTKAISKQEYQALPKSKLQKLLTLNFVDREIEAKPLPESSYIQAPELEIPVNDLLNRLARANGITNFYRADITRDKEYQALFLVDGRIVVSLGALKQLESPEELALLLAHELSHQKLRYSEKAKATERLVSFPRILGAVFLGMGSGTLLGTILGKLLKKKPVSLKLSNVHKSPSLYFSLVGLALLAGSIKVSSLAQKQRELEADRCAIYLLKNAGLPVKSIDAMMSHVEQAEKELNPGWKAWWVKLFRNHPKTEMRAIMMKDLAQQLSFLPSRPLVPVMAPDVWNRLKAKASLLSQKPVSKIPGKNQGLKSSL